MKLTRIIYILFILLPLSVFSNSDDKTLSELLNTIAIDSLDFEKIEYKIQLEHSKSVINNYLNSIENDKFISNNDLKKVSIGYAILNDDQKATETLDKYIKATFDRSILDNEAFVSIENSPSFIKLKKKYAPKINGWIILFFSSGLIGVFISIVLNLRREGDKIANVLISLFVLMHSLFMIHLCLFLSNYGYEFPNSLYMTGSFSFLYGPLLFFYFKRISGNYRFRVIDSLHLLPSIILFLYLLPFYLLPSEKKLHLMFNRDEILHPTLVTIVILKSISLMTYGILIYKIYVKNKKVKKEFSFEILKWQKNISTLNLIYVLSYLAYGAAIMKIVNSNILIYPQVFSMGIIVLYVAFIAYVQPIIFSGEYLSNDIQKYQKSGLTEDYSIELKDQLLKLFYEDKIYKENNINLDHLSERLGTNRHSASQVINEHFNMNFFNLINKFRIEEAQEIFKSDFNNNLNIIDVAYDVGFNNKVTFNKAFKEYTNLTPSEYIKCLKKQKSLDIA